MIIIDKNLYDLIRLNRFVSWLALRFGEARGYPCANGLACWEHGNLHREDPTCATNTFWLSNISWIQRLWCPKTQKSVWKRGLLRASSGEEPSRLHGAADGSTWPQTFDDQGAGLNSTSDRLRLFASRFCCHLWLSQAGWNQRVGH